MSNREGNLFVVSGPSGTGKSTLIERFLGRGPKGALFRFLHDPRQAASRGRWEGVQVRRRGDIPKDDRAGQFLEWENVHGYCYGTPVGEVADPLIQGFDVVLDVDVKGALRVKGRCERAVLIFVDTPSIDELVRRLSIRGERRSRNGWSG